MIGAFILRVMHFYSHICYSNALCGDSSHVKSGRAGSQAFEHKVYQRLAQSLYRVLRRRTSKKR
jgi:hypothetical protein